ncbi:hypothetical protein M569_16951, partial [Genlisea aurea]
RMIKGVSSRAPLIIRINLVFLALFLFMYAVFFPPLYPSRLHFRAASLVICSFRECRPPPKVSGASGEAKGELIKRRMPSFLRGSGMRIATVNMEGEDMSGWKGYGETVALTFERVSELLQWKDVFPEWIDEEEEFSGPECPEIPMPDWEAEFGGVDMVVAKLPCKRPRPGWERDVFRLQVHLAAANAAVRWGRRDRGGRMKMVFLSHCEPMMDFFRCDEMAERDGYWSLYSPEMERLRRKVGFPVGSCDLALPLWARGIDRAYDLSGLEAPAGKSFADEAYATVLHSSDSYVCGAVALAQSLLRTATRRRLLLLLDDSISEPKRSALSRAGWTLRSIKRIRNPRAERGSYNEYNYSKLRLWQLTEYRKIVFIDSDIVVLQNLDFLFRFPQMSAAGNDGFVFNSGVMVIEPSRCVFRTLMRRRKDVVSYNGGDQGFLNEIFVWWHRLPRRANFLKNFWSNSSVEAAFKNQMFRSEPPGLYAIHYLGVKPWDCYRDYDCNWDAAERRVYASDAAHARWWMVHDAMDEELQRACGLTAQRVNQLEWDRKVAGELAFQDRHWSINVTDPRK